MTQERLDQYVTIRREVRQIQELQDALSGSKSSVPAKMYPNVDKLHDELMDHYSAKLQELYTEQLAIEKAIEALPGKLRILMRYRYLDGLKWEQVCAVMSYSWSHTHRLHDKAIELIEAQKEGRG